MVTSPTSTGFSRTVLAPLTTIFTPPSTCTSLFQPFINDTLIHDPETASLIPQSLSGIALQAVKCNATFDPLADNDVLPPYLSVTGPLDYDFSCWPPATKRSLITSANELDLVGSSFGARGFYSPGLVCPSGYTKACTASGINSTTATISKTDTVFNFQFPLLQEETAAGCCPTGFDCFLLEPDNWKYQTCLSLAQGGIITLHQCFLSGISNSLAVSSATFNLPVVATATGPTTIPATFTTTESLETISPLVTASSVTEFTFSGIPIRLSSGTAVSWTGIATSTSEFSVVSVFAPLIQLNWKASDMPLVTSSIATTSGITATATSRTTSSQARPTGLSKSGIIAISVVIPIAIFAIGALLVTFFFHRRQRNQRSGIHGQEYDKPELDAFGTIANASRHPCSVELPISERRIELGPDERHELPAPNVVHEMGTSVQGSFTDD